MYSRSAEVYGDSGLNPEVSPKMSSFERPQVTLGDENIPQCSTTNHFGIEKNISGGVEIDKKIQLGRRTILPHGCRSLCMYSVISHLVWRAGYGT